MNPISAVNPGMTGIRKGLEDLNRAASEIASADQFTADSPVDLADSMVTMQQAQIQIAASAKAVKTMEESVNYLLDVFA